MQIYEGKELEVYKKEQLQINPEWGRRDFTKLAQSYLESKVEKVLAISGLRGTGKTVGLLQASEELDIAYILAEENDGKTGQDYIDYLKNTDKKYIVLDEYGWIGERDQLDRYLITSVQNGKRIVITGTESIVLDYLNYGALIHRVQVIHTTMFPYDEYRRVYNLEHSRQVCDNYLIEGGLFKEYVLKDYASMKEYIETAIVSNLANYLKKEMNEETARTLTYAVLFKAVCPSNLSTVPVLRESNVMLENFLYTMGINTDIKVEERYLNRVADIFEQTGIIVRIPNYDTNSSLREQYYIVNPSLTSQLIKATYGLPILDDATMGHIFEACAMVQISTNKIAEHEVYFLNNEGQSNTATKELDIVVTDINKEHIYLLECKHSQSHKIKANSTLVSGYLEEHYFQEADIDGRYVIYNGKPCVKEYDVGDVVFTPLNDTINNYFAFGEHIKRFERITMRQNYDFEVRKYGFKLTKNIRSQYEIINKLQNRFVPLREIADMYKNRSSLPDEIREPVTAMGDELKEQQIMRQKEAQTFLPE